MTRAEQNAMHDAEAVQAKELRDLHPEWTNEQIGDVLYAGTDLSPDARRQRVEHRLRRPSPEPVRFPAPLGIAGIPNEKTTDSEPLPPFLDSDTPRFLLPDAPAPLLDTWPRIPDNHRGFGIIGDIHAPSYRREVIESFVMECYKRDVREFIIIGDMSNVDAYSKFGRGNQQSEKLQDECETVASIFRYLMQWFMRGHFIPGNHDERFKKQMQNHFDSGWILPRLYDTDDRIRFYEHGRLEVTSGEETYTCIHGVNYSKTNPLKVVQDYAELFGTHTIMGHMHLSVQGWDRTGKHRCVCIGGAFDDRRMGYKQFQPSVFPKGVCSYGILQNGRLDVIHPGR